MLVILPAKNCEMKHSTRHASRLCGPGRVILFCQANEPLKEALRIPHSLDLHRLTVGFTQGLLFLLIFRNGDRFSLRYIGTSYRQDTKDQWRTFVLP